MHLGIDYGSKLAGTTAICYQEGDELKVIQSEKKKDADKFILEHVNRLSPAKIFIDATLSLPLAYFDKGDDYFYRSCDRELKAMSPMFLGGLTARAMRLTKNLSSQNIQCFEAYPGGLVVELGDLKKDYTKKSMVNTSFLEVLSKQVGLKINGTGSWHQIDAVLCWLSGKRYEDGKAKIIGEENEGLIII